VEVTLDSVRDVWIYQRRHGYRFSLDAVLLAFFVRARALGSIVDLGAGAGVVGILLARRYPAARVTLLELQEGLYTLAARNIEKNGLGEQVRALRRDIRDLKSLGDLAGCDLAVSNPPFRKPLTGKLSAAEERSLARHELALSLRELVGAAARLTREKGRFCLVHHPLRLAELTEELRRAGLQPKRLRFVHGRRDAEARILLMEAVKGGGEGLKVERPLFVYEEDGRTYTEEVRSMCEG
jgi:tRNA1Val (adenine37-N6)-methyltransferase